MCNCLPTIIINWREPQFHRFWAPWLEVFGHVRAPWRKDALCKPCCSRICCVNEGFRFKAANRSWQSGSMIFHFTWNTQHLEIFYSLQDELIFAQQIHSILQCQKLKCQKSNGFNGTPNTKELLKVGLRKRNLLFAEGRVKGPSVSRGPCTKWTTSNFDCNKQLKTFIWIFWTLKVGQIVDIHPGPKHYRNPQIPLLSWIL